MTIDKPTAVQLPLLRRLWQEAFGDTEEFLNDFYRTAFSAERCRCVLVKNELAAALYWFDCLYQERRAAYLYAVATSKAYRGQGLCHMLMQDTHQHLAKLGYEGAILVPGSESLFRFYEGMGYRICSHIRQFSCAGTPEGIPIRRIDKKEYAKLRRQMLPKDAVVQENENLAFLETQEEFYSGSDFLLAAHGTDNTLYAVELLGNERAASGIVNTLNYAKGIFRTPGGTKPFAMYYPLGNSMLPPPAYFGLAFD